MENFEKLQKTINWLNRHPRTLSGTIFNFRRIGRNEICPLCDSGLKYKKCCLVSENLKNRYIENKYKESLNG